MKPLVWVLGAAALLLVGGECQAFRLLFADVPSVLPEGHKTTRLSRMLLEQGVPVHEKLLRRTLGCAADMTAACTTGLEGRGIAYPELLRGLRWPDNPAFYVSRGRVGANCRSSDMQHLVIIKPGQPRSLSPDATIICWVNVMLAGPDAAAEVDLVSGKRWLNSSYVLPLRSHYGDMQFLHAMAPNGQAASRTYGLIRAWSRLTFQVVAGNVDVSEKVFRVVARDPELAILETFFKTLPHMAVADLLDYSDATTSDARGIALGALLHMVQDSYAPCHTERMVEEGMPRIKRFMTFQGQDEYQHGQGDLDQDDHFGKLEAGPVDAGARILQALRAGSRDFRDISPVIDEVFRPAATALRAAPGRCKREESLSRG